MLTCKNMLQNISKGQSAIPLKYLIIGLENDYKLMKNHITLMYVKRNIQSVIMFYKAPSSTFKTLMYDVVLEFFEHNIVKVTPDTPFKVYCNSPSFYFRYANTFKRHGSLLYVDKYPAMVNDEADIRNPTKVSGFDKYIYACLRLSMQKTVDELIEDSYQDKEPTVDSFNKKRFEYLKLQKLKKVAKDGIV